LFIEAKNFDEARIESMKVAAVHTNRHEAGEWGQSPLPWRPTYELASTQGKPPGIMRGARDTDSRIGHNVYSHVGVASKTVLRVGAQIHLVVATSNPERLR
jgi:hypothetical protein